MGVYAYCVVPDGHAPAGQLHGLQGAPVEMLAVGGIAVWISHTDRPEPEVAAVTQHNAVVEAAVTEEVTPVPLRFGQWLEDESALRAGLADKVAAYQQALRQFAGCLEFGLRLIDPNEAQGARDVHTAGATSGYEYMQALRENSRLAGERRAHAERVLERIRERMQDIVQAEREEAARTPHAIVTISHLVSRPDFDEYRERARALRAAFPELRLLLSGPWPPYSFAV